MAAFRLRTATRAAALALSLASIPFAGQAARLLGSDGGGTPSDLYVVNPTTGAVTPIGPIGVGITGLAVHPTTRVLYGVSPSNGTGNRSLYTIDPVTGTGTLVGALGLATASAADIAFRADGVLFGWSEDTDDLVTIDLGTGTATVVADSTLATAGSGLSFDATGVLYFAGNFDGQDTDPDLVTIDPVTGLLADPIGPLGPLADPDDRIGALAFHPATGVLFGIDKTTNNTAAALITIDAATAAVTTLGPTSVGLDALAFEPVCADGAVDAPWETCDDGNTVEFDGCSAGCQEEVCGDGTQQPDEACDDGNTVDRDGCSSSCEVELCLATPVTGCGDAGKASLSISEKTAGKEKLKASLSKLVDGAAQADFGDPVAGDTRVDVCLYDGAGAFAGELVVERAGELCGPKQKPCWKAVKTTGFSYADKDAAASGVTKLGLKGGAPGKGKLQAQAGNQGGEFPTGLAATLQGETAARIQLVVSDGACFEAHLGEVKKADGVQFKAKGGPVPVVE
ncbi:MAG TPA: DUF4215 domain-containing protein [Myxococcota bacterium]|nr:DUF4215 domain-containing protein [Myxococcota bacterium]